MKTVKTIKQYNITYTIEQQGNRTFRVSYTSAVSNRIQHVITIFDSVTAAEKFVKSCKPMDWGTAM